MPLKELVALYGAIPVEVVHPTLLIRINRQKQRLLAYGLSDHYRQIFDLTRLDEAIGIFGTEAEAVAAAH